MNKKQEELMEKIKKMQEKTVKKQVRALRVGYFTMVLITASISWLLWTQLAKIDGIPYLTYWQGLVYTLLVYSTIFLTARVVRFIQKGK